MGGCSLHPEDGGRISGLEKREKSGKRDPPDPEHLEGSSPANTLVLAP